MNSAKIENNKELLLEIELQEAQKKKHDQNLETINNKVNELENLYNTKEELNKLNIEFEEELKNIKNNYENEYKIFQDELRKIESKRHRLILLNNSFKTEIDINNNIIFKKTNYKLTLEIRTENLEKILKEKNDLCNIKLKNINPEYQEILLKSLYTGSCILGGSIQNKLIELEKYNDLFNKFQLNINKKDITDENKLEEFKKYNNLFINFKINIDETEYKTNHENIIKNKKIFFESKLDNYKRYYKLEINSIINLISYYNSLKKLNNIDEIVKLKENQNKLIVNLDSEIDTLEKKFKLLNQNIDSHNSMCQRKINKILCDKNKKYKSINDNKSE